ncbi:MAG TPA: phosphatase PAP2 family protein [Firmicutes bacterium]|nr:phosphatase PAP2 family protein [Bacillota bacterium]
MGVYRRKRALPLKRNGRWQMKNKGKYLFFKKAAIIIAVYVIAAGIYAQESVFERVFFEGFKDMAGAAADNPAETVLAVSCIALASYGIMKNEKWMFESIQGIEGDFWKDTFEYADYLGDGIFVLAANSFFFLGGEKEKQTAGKVIESIAIAGAVTYGIKIIAGRNRPSVTNDPYMYNMFSFSDMSMPSGHTTVAFAWASVIGDRYDIGYITYPAAVLTGLARVYKNKHWLSDVLIGAAIGTFAGKIAVQDRDFNIAADVYKGSANIMAIWDY